MKWGGQEGARGKTKTGERIEQKFMKFTYSINLQGCRPGESSHNSDYVPVKCSCLTFLSGSTEHGLAWEFPDSFCIKLVHPGNICLYCLLAGIKENSKGILLKSVWGTEGKRRNKIIYSSNFKWCSTWIWKQNITCLLEKKSKFWIRVLRYGIGGEIQEWAIKTGVRAPQTEKCKGR